MADRLHIVHTESSCGWGGQELRILTEAQGMVGRGHRVTLVCCPRARIAEEGRGRGLQVVCLPIEKKRVDALVALWRWLRGARRDVSIINTHSSTDAWLVAIASRLMRDAPPMIRTRHVSSPIDTSFATRWLYMKASRHLVVTGEPLRQALVQHNGFALDHMSSVPTGVDLGLFAPSAKLARRQALGLGDVPTVGILATLRNWKGHRYLFEAMAQLVAQGRALSLLVIGDGPQRGNLERLAASLNIAGVVRFLGHRPDPEVWLPAMDVFVLPSYGDEGVSQAVMQAMACGLPVITTDVGGMREAVSDGEDGLFVPVRDSAAIAAAIARLLDDPPLAQRLGANALAKARANFGVERMLDRMEALFLRYARGGRH